MIKLAMCSLNIELSFETNFFELNMEINDVSLNLESPEKLDSPSRAPLSETYDHTEGVYG